MGSGVMSYMVLIVVSRSGIELARKLIMWDAKVMTCKKANDVGLCGLGQTLNSLSAPPCHTHTWGGKQNASHFVQSRFFFS
jgi:hypothetical protein